MNRRAMLGGTAAALATSNAVALPKAGKSNAEHPDAALIAASERFIAQEAEFRRLTNTWFDAEHRLGADSPECIAGEAAFDAHNYCDDTLAAIAAAKPQTPAGLRAKARVVWAFYQPDFPQNGIVDDVLWSLIREVAGVAP